jgi:hypothetical protein
MAQEADRAITAGQVDVSKYANRGDAIKAIKATKKFKAYVAELALKTPKTEEYFFYLANIIRALVMNATGGSDIAETVAWKRKRIPVNAEYVPPAAVRPQGATTQDGLSASELYQTLQATQNKFAVDPAVIRDARKLGLTVAGTATIGDVEEELRVFLSLA